MLVLDAPPTPGHRPASEARTLPRRSMLLGAGLAAGSALLAGCGATGAPPPGPGTVSALDQRGRRITLPGPARRIVTIVIPAASLLVALDSGPGRLVGMNSSAAEAIRGGILGEIFPEAATIRGGAADQSFVPNIEEIVGLDPDLVVQWADRGSALVAPLENAGLTVAGLTYGTQADLETWIALFGALIGKPERAATLLARMRQRLGSVRAAAAPAGPAPKIVYFNQMRGGLKIAGRDTYNDFYINLVGGTNPAAGLPGITTVNVEQVLAWDPDIVLVGNFDDASPDQDVYRVPAWAGMSAVRSRRVYKIPLGGYRWDPPSQESPLMWRWLRALAFPGDGSGHDGLRAEMVDDYRFLYGHTLTQAQIDRILAVEANAGSAHYDLFGA
jgi:iron complex transport system substrate-binding protein